MNLECIVSMANRRVRLRFLAMERSLRQVGCDLPLRVIPYDDDLFELPPNVSWWKMDELCDWLSRENAHPTMRKYQCLTLPNYQFVDSDVCFLRDPAEVLQPHAGFVTCCTHWHNPGHTYTDESRAFFASRSTTWQRDVFNTGQFACDDVLYDLPKLQETAMQPEFKSTCVSHPSHTLATFHEQPGVNFLVAASNVARTNLTLPPTCMESTWAGDYAGDYEVYWRDAARKPYLIHWAGTDMSVPRPINDIFYGFLTRDEKAEWDAQVQAQSEARRKAESSARARMRRLKGALNALK